MVIERSPKKEHELTLLITPWAIGHRAPSGISHHPFDHAPFHKNEKGIAELKERLQALPDPKDESPISFFASPYYSFVPEDLYEEADENRMLDLAFSESFDEDSVRSERSIVTNARVVHWFPAMLHDALTQRYPGFIPHHFTIPAIETLLALHTKEGVGCGLAHIRHGEVDVGFAAEGGLRIFNSFSYANAEELVYFILHTWRTCGAGENLQRSHVTGTTEQGAEKELLTRYVKDPVFHEDGEGHWSSFLMEGSIKLADHRRNP